MPSVSPFLGALVVNETDCLMFGSRRMILLQIVVFPAPEGAEITKILPLAFLCNVVLSFKEPLCDGLGMQRRENDMVAIGDYDGARAPALSRIDEFPVFLCLFPHPLDG